MTATSIRLIAPSGYPHDRPAVTRGVARLRAAGCAVDGLEVLDRAELRYAGADPERVADINALATAEVLPDIALAIRGGYGATRLLEHLHYDALRERLAGSSTLLVGHSDFTALQLALYTRAGLTTFGGPMLGPDFGATEPSAFTWQHFWQTLTSPHASGSWKTPGDAELEVDGPLWGGNLAVLCSLIGRPYFPASASRRSALSACCTSCTCPACWTASAHWCWVISASAAPAPTTTAMTSTPVLPRSAA